MCRTPCGHCHSVFGSGDFVGKLRDQYFWYLRLAQGSRGAPLAWGRFIASMGRLAQAVVGTHASRLQILVDDPILFVAGHVVERQEMIGLFIFVLRLVNLKLAYHKGQYGRSVDWIGVTLHFCNYGIIATIKQEKRSELQKLIANTLQDNVVSLNFCNPWQEAVGRGSPPDHVEAVFA